MLSSVLTLLSTVLAFPIDEQTLTSRDALRLIETSPGETAWLDEESVLDLKRANVNFMDITNHPPSKLAGVSSTSVERNATVFPTKVHERKLFEKLSPELSKENLESTLTKFSSFYTRYAKSETGLDSSLWLFETAKGLAKNRDDVSARLFDHEWLQKSVLLRIEGSENPDKVVVVGAHQDSINLLMPSVLPSPGADDDGSGTVTTLEVLRVLLENNWKPKNTVEFHWYSAEELGLLGSQDVFAEYAEKDIDVRSMLQQDMTGYSAGSKEQNDGKDELGVITDHVDPDLTEFIKLVIDEYCSIPYVETSCGYACSDHSSASKHGYQSAFVIESAFENVDHKIHTTEDKVEYLDFDHMLEHAKLTLGYAIELGGYAQL